MKKIKFKNKKSDITVAEKNAYYKVVNDIDFMNAVFGGVKGEFTTFLFCQV